MGAGATGEAGWRAAGGERAACRMTNPFRRGGVASLLRNGEVKTREVVIGARNDTDVEIAKGLEEGDEVIIGEGKAGAVK